MRALKKIFFFLVMLVGPVYATLNATDARPVEGIHAQPKTERPHSSGKVSVKKITGELRAVDRANDNKQPDTDLQKEPSPKREIKGKRSKEDDRENIFKSILIAVAWALVSIVLGVLLVVAINLLFPGISPEAVLLITLIVTVVLSVVLPRVLNQ